VLLGKGEMIASPLRDDEVLARLEAIDQEIEELKRKL